VLSVPGVWSAGCMFERRQMHPPWNSTCTASLLSRRPPHWSRVTVAINYVVNIPTVTI
jgi:hypothetical protein